jgi:AmmeMemoRadiSam system protein B
MPTYEGPVYATQPHPLRNQIADLYKKAPPPAVEGEVMALIVPDTNLLSGGHVAARVYKALEGRVYDTVILIAPSHTGSFRRINICSLDTYRTPLGELAVNDRVRNELCDEDDDIFLDDLGHFHTEGVDVQLPFLQTILPAGFDVVPVVMGEETPEFCFELGTAIGEVMYNRRTLVVASADIVSAPTEALLAFRDAFERGDVSRLMGLLNSETVRLEGRGPLLVALLAALHRSVPRMHVLHLEPPQDGQPGYIGAVLTRG